MHNAAFAALGLDWAYVALPTPPERLEEAVRGLAALGFAGANVTTPHKRTVTAFCETDAPSVNTLVVRDGRVEGWTTDAAILDGLTRRRPGRASATVEPRRPSCRRCHERAAVRAARNVAARRRATPISSSTRRRSATRCSSSSAHGQTLVDLPYPDTATAVAARASRCRVITGLEVLLAQGAAAFELWTGVEAPVEVMRDALGLPA